MKLYFGNTTTTVTTVMILALLGFMGYSIMNRASIQYWGRRSLILLVFGLVLCCFAAARDGLDKTIQCAIDGSCAPGIFPLVSVPTIIGCIGALLIIIAAIATPIAKTQKMTDLFSIAVRNAVNALSNTFRLKTHGCLLRQTAISTLTASGYPVP